MKYFIISDVHSFYNEMIEALNEKGFDKNNQDHTLISLGDLLDRGPDSLKCLQFINNLKRKICIMGNHELLMKQLLNRGFTNINDIHNGTMGTVEQVTNMYGYDIEREAIKEFSKNKLWKNYFNSCVSYAEIGSNIFVHGWIPCIRDNYSDEYYYDEDWRDSIKLRFEDSTWYNGMEAWRQGVKEEGKTIWCGHWHSSYGHANIHNYGVEFVKKIETYHFDEELGREVPFACYDTFKDNGIVAMDACTVLSHKVNCEVIEI